MAQNKIPENSGTPVADPRSPQNSVPGAWDHILGDDKLQILQYKHPSSIKSLITSNFSELWSRCISDIYLYNLPWLVTYYWTNTLPRLHSSHLYVLPVSLNGHLQPFHGSGLGRVSSWEKLGSLPSPETTASNQPDAQEVLNFQGRIISLKSPIQINLFTHISTF